jgi:hypothetical protein
MSGGMITISTGSFADAVMTTNGDMVDFRSGARSRLAIGAENSVLTVQSSLPEWTAATNVIGQQDLTVPSSAMWTTTTAGAEFLSTEVGADKPMYQTFDFDQSTEEHVQFTIPMPRNYNNGTITARFYWLASSSSGDVVWSLAGTAFDDDDPIDASFGTEQTTTSTMTATNDVNVSDFTTAMTLAGTPADGAMLQFQVSRNAGAGGDTLAADAKLFAIVFTYTLDAATT